jgi:hypothetical protein
MIKPAKDSAKCGLQQLPEINLESSEQETSLASAISGMIHTRNSSDSKLVSLFEQRRLKGWWPCIVETADQREIAVYFIQFINFVNIHHLNKRVILIGKM